MDTKPTIKDVAREAGVSIATVSRVINHIEGVSPETIRRVHKALNELNYQINSIARSLKLNSTNTIGILTPNFTNIFYNDLFERFEKKLSHQGYSLIICSSENDKQNEFEKVRMFIEKKIDALILFPVSDDCTHISKLHIENKIPVVMVDRIGKGLNVDCVLSDNFYGSYELTKALIMEGCTRIGFIGGDIHVSNAQSRYQGYCQAMEDFGLAIEKDFVVMNGDTSEAGYAAIEKISHMKNHPFSFVLENHMTHVGFTSYLSLTHSMKEFKQYKVASYDYIVNTGPLPLYHYAMYQPLNKIVQEVNCLLINQLEGKTKKKKTTVIIKPIMKILVANGGVENGSMQK